MVGTKDHENGILATLKDCKSLTLIDMFYLSPLHIFYLFCFGNSGTVLFWEHSSKTVYEDVVYFRVNVLTFPLLTAGFKATSSHEKKAT